MVVRMRHTRSHTANRRSHHALSTPSLSKDEKGGGLHLNHRASLDTGMYNGREVKSLRKKLDRRIKRDTEKAKREVKQS